MKKALIIVICIVSLSITFYLGKISKNIATVDNFATSLADFKLDIQHLERELAKNGIEARDGKAFNSEAAFVKAESLLKTGDLANAGLYFSNGISREPGNWNNISRYQQSVLDYCHQLNKNGNYKTAINVLNDMDTFIRTQALYISVQDIEKLQLVLTDIAKFKQSIMAQITKITQDETTKLIQKLLAQSDKLLAVDLPTDKNGKNLSLLETFKENLLELQSLDVNIVEQNSPEKIARNIKNLEDKITVLEQHLVTVQTAETISTLAQQATQFINNAKNEQTQPDFILYYLTSAESIIRQLVLVAPNTKMTKTQIATLSKQLDQAKQEIAKRQSEYIWIEIANIYNNLNLKHSKYQKNLEELMNFRKIIAEKASKLSSIEILEKAQSLMEEVNKTITDFQTKQVLKYERWAINVITNFYNSYEDELGMGNTDEENVYYGIINNLSNIDLRYLSTPAQTAYNEAFQKFYAELDDEQKIPLSSKMALTDKKPLSDF